MQPSVQKLKAAVYKRSPVFREIMVRHGNRFLYDYAKDFVKMALTPRLDKRKADLIRVVGSLLERRLGKRIVGGVTRQLKKNALISTADHHGLIGHPFFLNSNLVTALATRKDPSFPYLVVFSFASISLNNSSCPRSVEFHGEGGKGRFKFPLLPDRFKMVPAYVARPIRREDVLRACRAIDRRQKAGDITTERAQTIQTVLKDIRQSPLVAPLF